MQKRVLRKSKSNSGAQYFRSEFISPPGFDAGSDSASSACGTQACVAWSAKGSGVSIVAGA